LIAQPQLHDYTNAQAGQSQGAPPGPLGRLQPKAPHHPRRRNRSGVDQHTPEVEASAPVHERPPRLSDKCYHSLLGWARETLGNDPYSLPAGTSVMLGSILRYPRLSMIQGCSQYGGSSSAAVLGSKTGCPTCVATTSALVGRSRLASTEYAFIRASPSCRSSPARRGVGLREPRRCDFRHTQCLL
jgi:hypothetical protein